MTIKKILGKLGFKTGNREDYGQRQFILDVLPKDSIGAEIGVHEGDFSRLLLSNVRPARLHLIDPWEYRNEPEYSKSFYGGRLGVDQHAMDERYTKLQKIFRKNIEINQVVVHRQRSSMALDSFPLQYFDWVYIDGDHLYKQVKNDLDEYRIRVKPSGWIAGGGYRTDAWWGDDVVRAVKEFVATVPHQEFIARGDQFLIRITSEE